MEIPYDRWFPVIAGRRSRREFRPEPLPVEITYTLKKTCRDFRPFPDVRVELITEDVNYVFKFIAAAYGTIKGPQGLFAFIGKTDNPHIREQIGYTGQGLILEATALGLGTCWVTGSYRMNKVREIISLQDDEKIMAVSPLGFATLHIPLREKIMGGMINHTQRKPLKSLVKGLNENQWAEWVRPALEAARLAPSDMNRQPWRFDVQEKLITVSYEKGLFDRNPYHRLNCGIAMLNLEVAALNQGIKGRWQLLHSPKVASFRI